MHVYSLKYRRKMVFVLNGQTLKKQQATLRPSAAECVGYTLDISGGADAVR